MVFTTRLAGGRGGRNGFETELRRLGVIQKNSRPNHPTTCGKVERFQQTMKKWLRRPTDQPATIAELQALLDPSPTSYNQHRPHRSLPHRATPATAYTTRPKATPGGQPRRRHPRPGPPRPRRQSRQGHPAPRRPPPPHRHRPNPRPNPRHRCSSKTSTSASSTPPPANSSASSPSTPPATTSPPADHPDPPANNRQPNPQLWVRPVAMS